MRDPDNYYPKHKPLLFYIEPGVKTSDSRVYEETNRGNLVRTN